MEDMLKFLMGENNYHMKNILTNKWFKFSLVLIIYLLWAYWVGSWWWLLIPERGDFRYLHHKEKCIGRFGKRKA